MKPFPIPVSTPIPISISISILILVVSFVFALAGCGEPPPKIVAGSQLPSIEIPRLDGGDFDLAELRGTPSVVAFWATWCRPCRKDEPVLHELLDRGLDGAEVGVVTVALDERTETVEDYVAEAGLRYPVLVGDQALFSRFDGYNIPHTLVVDAAGTVRAVYRGPITVDDVRSALETGDADPGPAG